MKKNIFWAAYCPSTDPPQRGVARLFPHHFGTFGGSIRLLQDKLDKSVTLVSLFQSAGTICRTI